MSSKDSGLARSGIARSGVARAGFCCAKIYAQIKAVTTWGEQTKASTTWAEESKVVCND